MGASNRHWYISLNENAFWTTNERVRGIVGDGNVMYETRRGLNLFAVERFILRN